MYVTSCGVRGPFTARKKVFWSEPTLCEPIKRRLNGEAEFLASLKGCYETY